MGHDATLEANQKKTRSGVVPKAGRIESKKETKKQKGQCL
jgi:hypothetical protein